MTGHGTLILIEGLVVFVQTTRLILFEFFTRFLRADGRLFRPLNAPNRPPPVDHRDGGPERR
jgi:V/A-type H+-transporting ATPase subunit I